MCASLALATGNFDKRSATLVPVATLTPYSELDLRLGQDSTGTHWQLNSILFDLVLYFLDSPPNNP